MKYKVGDFVTFDVENSNLWVGDLFGRIIERSGELAIQTERSGVVTIGKGYDAYPGTIRVLERNV